MFAEMEVEPNWMFMIVFAVGLFLIAIMAGAGTLSSMKRNEKAMLEELADLREENERLREENEQLEWKRVVGEIQIKEYWR
jgi:regulator of replication initiation timing